MGLGTFDMAASNGSPANSITNIMAVNVGVKIKPMDKLTLNADVWYAALAEDDANGETDLGTEVDVKVTYALMDNLNLDLVGAYLFAGDATGDDDPVEVGARLSLKF
jgi:outer membrane protein W